MVKKRVDDVTWTCLINKAFGELLEVYDDSFSELFHLLTDKLQLNIEVNREGHVPQESLDESDIMMLGCPQKSFIDEREINKILRYVRNGGSLLVISDAGGDKGNETNLNDLLRHFNVEVEPTMVRDERNAGSTASPVLGNINISHPVLKNVVSIALGGACTLKMDGEGTPLIMSNKSSWIEEFTVSTNESSSWVTIHHGEYWPVAGALPFGNGKVVIIGDLDIFSNDEEYGLNAKDNRYLIENIVSWFLEPLETRTIMDWLISRITKLENNHDALKRENEMLHEENKILRREISLLQKEKDILVFDDNEDDMHF